MSLQDFILESINQSTQQVFSTMLGVELPPGELVEQGSVPEIHCEVVALIGVAGAWAGAGSISCSAEAACRVCAHMLMDALEPGGYFFTGQAESLAGISHALEYVQPALYRKPEARRAT